MWVPRPARPAVSSLGPGECRRLTSRCCYMGATGIPARLLELSASNQCQAFLLLDSVDAGTPCCVSGGPVDRPGPPCKTGQSYACINILRLAAGETPAGTFLAKAAATRHPKLRPMVDRGRANAGRRSPPHYTSLRHEPFFYQSVIPCVYSNRPMGSPPAGTI